MTIEIQEATSKEIDSVATLVADLLIELEPEIAEQIDRQNMKLTAAKLMDDGKIFAYLAVDAGEPVGVVTLHECAAIYAGGVFGEISEMYVKPQYRSASVGKFLINRCVEKAKELDWKRLEVGSPPKDLWPKTVAFYQKNLFEATGTRLRRVIG